MRKNFCVRLYSTVSDDTFHTLGLAFSHAVSESATSAVKQTHGTRSTRGRGHVLHTVLREERAWRVYCSQKKRKQTKVRVSDQ